MEFWLVLRVELIEMFQFIYFNFMGEIRILMRCAGCMFSFGVMHKTAKIKQEGD